MGNRLRFRDLKARGIVKNRPTLKNWIEKHGFPRGQLTGPNTRTWDEDTEINPWLASRPTGPKPEIPLKPGSRRGRPRKTRESQTAQELSEVRKADGASG
jgi:predicted DNA-binding transcriptional regulator AlpA